MAGASRNAVAGWLGDTLKVLVTAPAERGRANAAVELMIAGALGLPKESVRIVSGRTASRKVLKIAGLPEAEVYRRLSRANG